MRVGPILMGAAIGGVVWVVALRATSRAIAPGPTDGAPPPDVPDGQVRDAQGAVIGTVGETAPIVSPPAGTTELAIVAGDAQTTATPFQADAAIGGVDGRSGTTTPVVVDGETGTIKLDHNAPLGGQGADMLSSSPRVGGTDPAAPPSYVAAVPQYEDYLTAVSGSVQGMTRLQIADMLREGAQMGGLSL